MKKLAGILSGIMLITTLAVPAMAETAEENIDVHTNYVNVEINGEKYDVRNFLSENTRMIFLGDKSAFDEDLQQKMILKLQKCMLMK